MDDIQLKGAVLVAIYYLRKKKRLQRRKKRCYVRNINMKRLTEGSFVKLVMPMRTRHFDDHFNYFRMTPARFDDLLSRVGTLIMHGNNHRMVISPMERLAFTIRYLASGGSLSELSYNFRIGSSTAAQIVRETTAAIWRALKDEYLSLPDSQRWKEIAGDFERIWNFPLCVGSIDGKHVAIRNPPRGSSLYYNYKNFFSVVLLAIVDANYQFVFVDIGGYGSESDAALFDRSGFGRRLGAATTSFADGGLNLPADNYLPGTAIAAPHVFIGDQAFRLGRHLLRPYRNQSGQGGEAIFNYRLSRARRVVENAFGILSTRWRVLESKINLSVAKADEMIKACVCLHNYLKSTDCTDHNSPRYVPEHYVDYELEDGALVNGDWRINADHQYALKPFEFDERVSRAHYAIRELFKAYFHSEIGWVPWQETVVDSGRY